MADRIEIRHYFDQQENLRSIFDTLITDLPEKKKLYLQKLMFPELNTMGNLNFWLNLRKTSVEELKEILRPAFEKCPKTFKQQLLLAPQLKSLWILMMSQYLGLKKIDQEYLRKLEEDKRLVLLHAVFCSVIYLGLAGEEISPNLRIPPQTPEPPARVNIR